MLLLVSVAAAATASLSVGVAALQGRDGTAEPPAARPAARVGAPPLALDLGIRTDPEAVRLRRATTLLDRGRREQAARLFRRYRAPILIVLAYLLMRALLILILGR